MPRPLFNLLCLLAIATMVAAAAVNAKRLEDAKEAKRREIAACEARGESVFVCDRLRRELNDLEAMIVFGGRP